MKTLAVFLFAMSLAAQVNSPAPNGLLQTAAPLQTGAFLSTGITFTAAPSTAAPIITAPSTAIEAPINIETPIKPLEANRTAPPGRTFYRWSAAMLAVAGVADVASSWRKPEANPVVAGTGSTFGAGSVAIKLGLVGSSFLLEHLVLRHRPDLYRQLAWLNLGITGAQVAIVAHNLTIK